MVFRTQPAALGVAGRFIVTLLDASANNQLAPIPVKTYRDAYVPRAMLPKSGAPLFLSPRIADGRKNQAFQKIIRVR